ncbi:glycosyltransferase family 2 protein [Sorangium sp. So ce426]|uniref:glycosyltransferase family 2 protein n=1 Tax=unclassified Sorangium TaxID=2621164 RepID=UPI003F5C1F6A
MNEVKPLRQEPLVSVVIPTYNYGHFVVDAVESVLAQTYERHEIIVVDDGSSDDTPERLAPYRDRIRYVRQQNQGVSAARNLGIGLASGEWVALLDADDVWHPQKLALQIRVSKAHPDLSVIGGAGSSGALPPDLPEKPEVDRLSVVDFLTWTPLAQSSVMVRRRCFDQVGGFDVKIRYAEDREMWIRLAAAFATARVKEPLYYYRAHPEQVSRNAMAMYQGLVLVLDRFFKDNPRYRHIRPAAFAFLYRDATIAFMCQDDRWTALSFLLRWFVSYPRSLPHPDRDFSWERTKVFARLLRPYPSGSPSIRHYRGARGSELATRQSGTAEGDVVNRQPDITGTVNRLHDTTGTFELRG